MSDRDEDTPVIDLLQQMEDTDMKEFRRWLSIGLRRSWITEPACEAHEGVPVTAEEAAAFEAGDDPCVIVMRVIAGLKGDFK